MKNLIVRNTFIPRKESGDYNFHDHNQLLIFTDNGKSTKNSSVLFFKNNTESNLDERVNFNFKQTIKKGKTYKKLPKNEYNNIVNIDIYNDVLKSNIVAFEHMLSGYILSEKIMCLYNQKTSKNLEILNVEFCLDFYKLKKLFEEFGNSYLECEEYILNCGSFYLKINNIDYTKFFVETMYYSPEIVMENINEKVDIGKLIFLLCIRNEEK